MFLFLFSLYKIQSIFINIFSINLPLFGKLLIKRSAMFTCCNTFGQLGLQLKYPIQYLTKSNVIRKGLFLMFLERC